MAVIRGFQISIGSASPDKLSILHSLPLLRLDLPPNVQRIGFVNHVPQGDDNSGMGILRGEGIEVLIDRNEADIPQAEILLNVIARVDGVSSQSRKVFYNDAVHKS